MIIYLLTFYLFDEIEKNIKITHALYSATSKAILTKLLVQPERLYFLCVLCQELSIVIVLTEKNTKIIVLFKSSPCFGSLKLVTLIHFEEMLVLTSY